MASAERRQGLNKHWGGMLNRIQAFVLPVLLLAGGALYAKGAPDPRATALIQELELSASPVATRDLRGWKPPQRIVVATSDAQLLERLRAVAPEAEVVAAAEGEARVAAVSDTQDERYAILVAENLRRYVAGEPLLNVVDIERGY
jgi:hypothetical protein